MQVPPVPDCRTSDIRVENGFEHNLKGIDLRIAKGTFTVITGVSGSGKSTLLVDTLFKEAERLYFSSFPAWGRKYFGVVARPKADRILGLDAAVLVDQRHAVTSPRATVGTFSGTYDLLRLLFARFGKVPASLSLRPEWFSRPGILSRSLFSFNSDLGACPACRGVGLQDEIDPELVIADRRRSIRGRALRNTAANGYVIYSQVTLDVLDLVCRAHGFSIDTPLEDLTAGQWDVLCHGSQRIRVPFGKHPLESRMKWTGITARPREEGYYPGFVTVMEGILKRDRNPGVLRFARSLPCSACDGTRLRPEALAVTWLDRSIHDVASLPLESAATLLRTGRPAGAEILLDELDRMLSALAAAGLGHLSMARPAATLSGGEVQRIKIAALTQSRLRGVLYLFDEPTAGLHRTEAREVVRQLLELRDRGNTVVAVEHHPDTWMLADTLIELGPGGGDAGGRVIYQGPPAGLLGGGEGLPSPSGQALAGERRIAGGSPSRGEIVITGASRHNLRGITVALARETVNVVTGRSGAGKRSLLAEIAVHCERLGIPCQHLDRSPIGRTPRSNPATYTGLAERIRDLFAAQPEAQRRNLTRSHFSFNSAGGRCEACEGAGVLEIGMKYLGSVEVVCDRCHGRRFTEEVLRVRFRGRSMAEVYDLSVTRALTFFAGIAPLQEMLEVMARIGLGYLHLGQPTSSLSGGEAQRVRLAAFLGRKREPAVLLLEEPASGLHPQDRDNLVAELRRMAGAGHTPVVIEHDPGFIASAGHLIELGPGAGEAGGRVLYAGSVPGLLGLAGSPTATVLAEYLASGPGASGPRTDGKRFRQAIAAPLHLAGVTTHNLKGIDLTLAPGTFTVITGVSGSGKTSLAFDTLFPEALRAFLAGTSPYVQTMLVGGRDGQLESADHLMPPVAVSPGMVVPSARSTVGTVSGAYELVRMLYSRAGILPGGEPCPFFAGDFSFHSQVGACAECGATGIVLAADPDLVITGPERSFLDGALDGTRRGRFYGAADGQYTHTLRAVGRELGFDFERPVVELSAAALAAAWQGTGEWVYETEWHYARGAVRGTHRFSGPWPGFAGLIAAEYQRSLGNRNAEELRALMKEDACPACRGRRLGEELLRVTFAGLSIADMCALELADLPSRLARPGALTEKQRTVLAALAPELLGLLERMIRLGLGHLALDRSIASLSLGERERLRLARCGIDALSGILYILDEPSRGLHPADCLSLVAAIREIVAGGNTVVAVEHEPAIIREADQVVELGPGAGKLGGEVVFAGTVAALKSAGTATARALVPHGTLRESQAKIRLAFTAAAFRNLSGIDFSLPLGETTVVTGVSGSGKTTLLREVVAASLRHGRPIHCRTATPLPAIVRVFWHENRSVAMGGGGAVVATFAGVMDPLRRKFATSEAARKSGLKATHFSLTGEGACPACGGSGQVRVDLDFLAGSTTACPECDGRGFRAEILAITLDGRSIADVLAMSVGEAGNFLPDNGAFRRALAGISRCGLGYLSLGQPLTTLSSGEVLRLDLAVALNRAGAGESDEPAFFLFDEPSTGLHAEDIRHLLELWQELNQAGHTVLVADHRLQIAAFAHHLLDLGPGGGRHGGRIVFAGSPLEMAAGGTGRTADALRAYCGKN